MTYHVISKKKSKKLSTIIFFLNLTLRKDGEKFVIIKNYIFANSKFDFVSILQKSGENFDAVDLLMRNNLNAPVFHCAYYSSLQLLINFITKYSKLSKDEIRDHTRSEGSHNFYLNACTEEFKRLNRRNAVEFNNYFSQFKRKRREADYEDQLMTEEELIHAKERAIKIRKFIKLIEDEARCENIHTIKVI